jgi:hypothetical protein
LATRFHSSVHDASTRSFTIVTAVVLAAAALLYPSPSAANGPGQGEVFACPEVIVEQIPVGDETIEPGVALPGSDILIAALIGIEVWEANTRPAEFGDDCDVVSLNAFEIDTFAVTIRLRQDGKPLAWTYLDPSLEPTATPPGFPSAVGWVVSEDGTLLSADGGEFLELKDFFDYGLDGGPFPGFGFGDLFAGVVFAALSSDVPLGVLRIEMAVTFVGMDESLRSYVVDTALTIVSPEQPQQAAAAGPGASVSCSAPVAGAAVTCDLTSDPGVDFVWQASTNPVFATGVVTTDATGKGQFAFTVPVSALGQPVMVEIVAWTAASSIGVASGLVPTSVPSGGGPRVPRGELLVLGVVLLGAVVLVRPAGLRAGATQVG